MRRLSVQLVLLFACFAFSPSLASAQSSVRDDCADERESGFSLCQNYPNPFNPETRIPFALHEDLFADGDVRVSMRIYNVLSQFVVAPTALDHPTQPDSPLVDLDYSVPGRYEAFWDGKDQSGREVASGIYIIQMTVKGQVQWKRMFVAK